MATKSEFFIIQFSTLKEMAEKLNDKLDYYDEGIEVISQEREIDKKFTKKYYNFLCKGKY